MPQVLTTNARIQCPHGALGRSTASDPRWVVETGDVLLENDIGILSCPATPPCLGYTLVSMALNSVYVGTRRVILVTDFQKSDTGLPLTISEVHQTYDETSPAPLGPNAPPADPALQDSTPPTVIAVPSAAAFSTSNQQPASSPVTFNLFTAYPLLWNLTLLNSVNGTSLDATAGLPGLTVIPSGGQWTTSSLVISVIMTAVFFNALGPGPIPHELYLTGVSRRGLPAYARVDITVS